MPTPSKGSLCESTVVPACPLVPQGISRPPPPSGSGDICPTQTPAPPLLRRPADRRSLPAPLPGPRLSPPQVFSVPHFWLDVFVTTVVSLIPAAILLFYDAAFRPSASQRALTDETARGLPCSGRVG